MKTLIILAHPDMENSRINKRWKEELGKYPDKITIHELYKEYPDWNINIEKEQELLSKHDNIIFEFPLYWYSSPPILKKWFDEFGFSTEIVVEAISRTVLNTSSQSFSYADGILTRWHNAVIKRLIDIIGALAGIIVFSPIMLIVAIIIKLTSKGPIIFSQERVGLHNRAFKMYKFRSMKLQAPQAEKVAWTTPHDPRVTGIGKFIRKTSIDETPQFFNILKGDMSLIGPRPERPYYVEKFKEEIPQYMIKHQVRPGLTGWAQVNGYRGDTSIEKRIEYDLYYIENWTIGLDLKILFLTVFKGFINKNAY